MFINVTRYGASRQLRLAVAAIAYLDDGPEESAVVRLIGGDSLRTDESRSDIEAAIDATMIFATAELIGAPAREMVAGDIFPSAVIAPKPGRRR